MEVKGYRMITDEMLLRYMEHLYYEERSKATIEKYRRDIVKFTNYAKNQPVTKELTIAYKELLRKHYKPASANSMLAALNSFFSFYEWSDCKVRRISIQRKIFCDKEQELTKKEYLRLLEAAKEPKQERINLIIQTICGTGIRVSELKWITAEAVWDGQAVVECKGKVRTVFINRKLRKILLEYIAKCVVKSGPVFVTRTGKPVNRSNIWREMKELCETAGVSADKVFPHNLRHLFARTYYGLEKDIAKLADILGHSHIETTRIYILSSGTDHSRQVERLGLVL